MVETSAKAALLGRARRGHAGSLHQPKEKQTPGDLSKELSRLKTFCWNVGALSFAWNKLLPFLELHEYHIAVLTATHWKEDSEFGTCGWFLVGTGSTQKAQGVVILLSGKAYFQFNCEKPGRLLHVRVKQGRFTMDVFGVYQAVWAVKPQQSVEQLLHRRQQVWDAVRLALDRMSKRHHLLVRADFLCSVEPRQRWVGIGACAALQIRYAN